MPTIHLLSNGLSQLGIETDESVIKGFEIYLRELQKWNKAYNLTALTSDEDIIVKHFLDSLLYLKAFPENACTVCDAGSGAGFPGLPIALVRPDISMTLVEPSRKKCAFLRHMKRLLNLDNVTVAESRIEDLRDERFDIVLTRALFDAADFIKSARHLLKDNGFLLLSKGPKCAEEVQALPNTTTYEIITVPLPTTSTNRNLLKIRPTS